MKKLIDIEGVKLGSDETITRLLKPKQVAEILGVSVNAVYLWAKTFRIPSVTLGKSVRFKQSDIEAIINGQITL